MYSPCIREASEACFHGCCPSPFLSLPESHASKSSGSTVATWNDFTVAIASTLYPNTQFSNHESLPSLHESFSNFIKAYPQYSQSNQADHIRAKEYYHLFLSKHVCLDYIGHSLFSYSQQKALPLDAPIASSSSYTSSPVHPAALQPPFFDISYKSVKLNSLLLYGSQESELESKIRKRLMAFMNICEADYTMVFTANQSSAFKLLADSYPFQTNRNLLMVYDYQSEATEVMIESSKKRGARAMSAEFVWPSLGLRSGKLKKMITEKKGLFVFPLQSRMTGAPYSYRWMSLARENGWDVLLDACALGPKDMETLGLSIFRPDFLICSCYKIFGENPSGFGCLFVKRSRASILKDPTMATNVGIASLVPVTRSSQFHEEWSLAEAATKQKSYQMDLEKDGSTAASLVSDPISPWQMRDETSEFLENEEEMHKKSFSLSEILEPEKPFNSAQSKTTTSTIIGTSQIECRGLDHADSLGLIVISSRTRYLINWLVNALMSLKHPPSENGLFLVKIYGPKIKFDRGPVVSFNVFDWKGEKIDPSLVQKLADRNNISLSYGSLKHIWFSDKDQEDGENILETRTTAVEGTYVKRKGHKFHTEVSVLTAALGFLTNFEDTYRLWAFVSRFLDADFVEKERWRYTALNQNTVEV